ncbi:MAG: hypothetical protein ACUVRR_03645 [Candidatus Fervidibacter sp.]|uniref:hypothetical protein n=1 Tax=Candidatus Fervidibacter sp. TaxID=3100871 RepID=UPI00404ABD08
MCMVVWFSVMITLAVGLGVTQVLTDFDPNELIGQRPYEMDWANRKEPRPPTITFTNLNGWRMEVSKGVIAVFRPSREQNIWNRPIGKLTYRGNGDPQSRPTILLYPPKPIPIPDRSDCVEMWVYGNRWGWENPPDTPPVQIFIHLRNENGQIERVHLTTVNWKEWWLVHKRLFPVTRKPRTKGWQLEAIEIAGGWQPQDRTIYLDSITFYSEPLQPLKFPQRPKRNLTLFEGQAPGLNVGRGRLDFPVREETVLPINLTRKFRTEIVKESKGFALRYAGNDCTITYRFEPALGLSGITAELSRGVKVRGEKVALRPLTGAGVKFANGSNEGKLIKVELKGNVVIARYERDVTYRLRLWQKSLVVDIFCPNEKRNLDDEAVALDFGEVRLEHPDDNLYELLPVYVPFITYGGNSNPVVLMGRRREGKERVVFTSIWLDWYRSNGSEPYAFPEGLRTPTGIRVNGGVRYHPKTDGKRNDMFERIFVTVSPNFEEVLPVIPNPRGLHAHLAVDRLWQESWGPANYEQEMKRSEMLRAYGIVKLIQCNHEITWRDSGESFTLRTKAAPGKGGDEALKRYLSHQKSLGWFAGLYTNYCDFAPVNEFWDTDLVQRTSDGNLRPAWPRCYALKPAAAVMFHEKLAPVIKRKFHPDGKQVSAYTDVHTAAAPWGYCDYDARVPGAGTFAQTFYCYGELLRNDSRIYGGPVFSEGTFQWLYAGLADGNYALTYNGRPIAREPLLPVFYLREIHTKECGIGMGWTDFFLQGVPDWRSDIDKAIDRFLLHVIAYGNIGWLVEEKFGMERVCRSYYMLQRLQARYGLLPPNQIAYWDGNKLVSVSEALVKDLPRTRRQIFIAYPNGLKIWLNDWVEEGSEKGNGESVWKVTVNGKVYEIPPAGWLAVQGKNFLTFSALQEGHKVDYLRDEGSEAKGEPLLYADGRGKWMRFGEVVTKSPVAVRKINDNQVEVLDIAHTGEFGLKNPLGVKGLPVRCQVFDLQGEPLGEAEIRLTSDCAWFIGKPEGHRYLVTYEIPSSKTKRNGQKSEWWVASDTHEAAPGAKIQLRFIGVPDNAPVLISCQGARLEGLNLLIPKDATIGQRVWVRADYRGQTSWWDITVVPMVEWQVNLQPISSGESALKIRPRLHLQGLDGDFVEVVIQVPDWVSSTQTKFVLPIGNLPPHGTEIGVLLRTTAQAGTEGILKVISQIGEHRHEALWRLKVVEEPPVVVNLDKDKVPFFWGICRRGQKEQPDDGKSGATFHRHEGMPVGGAKKSGFFAHPPYIGGVGYSWAQFGPLKLPSEPCVFRSWIGLMDGGDPSDGVLFIVEVVDEQGNRHKLAEQHGVQKEWRELVGDLTKFAGQKIWLRLIADVGPQDNSIADWASWGEPRIEGKTTGLRLVISTPS